MAGSKDSAEVVKFMALFAKLKDWSDDNPGGLADLAKDDKALRDLCAKLDWVAFSLSMSERRDRALFAAPVDPKFGTAWRDFEERFDRVLADILLGDLFPELGDAASLAGLPTGVRVRGQTNESGLRRGDSHGDAEGLAQRCDR